MFFNLQIQLMVFLKAFNHPFSHNLDLMLVLTFQSKYGWAESFELRPVPKTDLTWLYFQPQPTSFYKVKSPTDLHHQISHQGSVMLFHLIIK